MLQSTIQEDLKQAMRDKDEVKVSTLRLLWSELKYNWINGKTKESTQTSKDQDQMNLSDEEVVSVIQREIKKRNESITQYRQANRQDLSQKEEAEAEILKVYLPPQLSDEELTVMVQEVIKELGAANPSDIGRVIGAVMGKVQGKAEGARVSKLVKEILNI